MLNKKLLKQYEYEISYIKGNHPQLYNKYVNELALAFDIDLKTKQYKLVYNKKYDVINHSNLPMLIELLERRAIVTHNFEFITSGDWIPGEWACWLECPFAVLLPPDRKCFYVNHKNSCPFSNNMKDI